MIRQILELNAAGTATVPFTALASEGLLYIATTGTVTLSMGVDADRLTASSPTHEVTASDSIAIGGMVKNAMIKVESTAAITSAIMVWG